MGEQLRFPSKIDWWIPSCIVLAAASAPVAIWLTGKGAALRDPAVLGSLVPALAIPVGLLAWIGLTTEYVINGDELFIKSGPPFLLRS